MTRMQTTANLLRNAAQLDLFGLLDAPIADPMQIDLRDVLARPAAPVEPGPTPPAAIASDTSDDEATIDRLIEAGLADRYSVSLGYHIRDPRHAERGGIWTLPSRLFQFPLSIKLADADRPTRIVIQHPALADHPFVREVADFTGFPVVEAVGSDGWGDHGIWHHAVDLISRGMWRELLATRAYTHDSMIAGAVSYGCRYSPHDAKKGAGYITTAEAREVLAAIGAAEPSREDSRAIVQEPHPCKQEKGADHWPINHRGQQPHALAAWSIVHGIEAGDFAHDRAGFLAWTQRGRDRASGKVQELAL